MGKQKTPKPETFTCCLYPSTLDPPHPTTERIRPLVSEAIAPQQYFKHIIHDDELRHFCICTAHFSQASDFHNKGIRREEVKFVAVCPVCDTSKEEGTYFRPLTTPVALFASGAKRGELQARLKGSHPDTTSKYCNPSACLECYTKAYSKNGALECVDMMRLHVLGFPQPCYTPHHLCPVSIPSITCNC